MELYTSVWHLISALLVFLGGASIAVIIGKRFFASASRSMTIYCWHTLLCMVYCWYALTYGGDAISYFKQAEIGGLEFSFGTAGIDYLTAIFVQGLGLSLLGGFLVFNIFGTIGLQAFDACLRIATQGKTRNTKNLATLIVFLPSVSFWSSAIGKDSLSFMAASLALWASLSLGRRWWLMVFSVTVMLLARPHIAAMMVMAWAFAVLVSSKLSLGKRASLALVSSIAVAIILPFALRYAGVGETIDAVNLAEYVEQRQSYNTEGGGGVDIASMSLPMKLITYMFRPFIFEVNSAFTLAAAIDNLILLYLFIMGSRSVFFRKKSGLGESRSFMLAYSLLTWITLSMTTANLGIALRQKWMFAPFLIFLLISVMGIRNRKKSKAPNFSSEIPDHHMRK